MPLKAGLRTIGASFPKSLALDEHVVPKTVAGAARARGGAGSDPAGRPGGRRAGAAADRCRRSRTGPNVSQSFYLRDVMQISVVGSL